MALTRISMAVVDNYVETVLQDQGKRCSITTSHDGSKDCPYIFTYGSDVEVGKYYYYADKLYLAKSDMSACIWPPDTEGLWQWELVV